MYVAVDKGTQVKTTLTLITHFKALMNWQIHHKDLTHKMEVYPLGLRKLSLSSRVVVVDVSGSGQRNPSKNNINI